METTEALLTQTKTKRFLQKSLQVAVHAVLRPQIFWADPSLKKRLQGQPAIFLCNHTAHLDGVFAGAILEPYQPYALVKRKWYDKPKTGKIIQMSRSIPIDPESTDIGWYQTAEALLQSGGSMLIFPEGAIAREGAMLPFQPGAGLLAAKTGALLVPMAIHGDYSFGPGKRQRVYVGRAIGGACPDNLRPSQYARQLMAEAEQQMHHLYGALEKKYGRQPVYYAMSYAPDAPKVQKKPEA